MDQAEFGEVSGYDTHGHAAGDRLLQGTTEVLTTLINSGEAIARLGASAASMPQSG